MSCCTVVSTCEMKPRCKLPDAILDVMSDKYDWMQELNPRYLLCAVPLREALSDGCLLAYYLCCSYSLLLLLLWLQASL